jgi:hypothetical protein
MLLTHHLFVLKCPKKSLVAETIAIGELYGVLEEAHLG